MIVFCPACGEEELNQWQDSIYECPSCKIMLDVDALSDEEEGAEQWKK